MGGRGVLEGAVGGVIGVRRGFQEVAGFLGVNGVAEGIFIVGGHRGDHGGIGGAEMVAVVMTKGKRVDASSTEEISVRSRK